MTSLTQGCQPAPVWLVKGRHRRGWLGCGIAPILNKASKICLNSLTTMLASLITGRGRPAEIQLESLSRAEEQWLEDHSHLIPFALGGDSAIIPPEVFTIPPQYLQWPAMHGKGATELPSSVYYFGNRPTYDDDVDDHDADSWAKRVFKERAKCEGPGWIMLHKRERCFGMAVYLQNRLPLWEWAKTKYVEVHHRNMMDESDGRWSPAGPLTYGPAGHSNKERYRAHRLLYPLTGPHEISTVNNKTWVRPQEPEPVAEWRMGHKCRDKKCKRCARYKAPWVAAWLPSRGVFPWRASGRASSPFVFRWARICDQVGHPVGLTLALRRLLFMNDRVVTDPYREKAHHEFAHSDENGLRVELEYRSFRSEWGVAYAKPWECYDHRFVARRRRAAVDRVVRNDDGSYNTEVDSDGNSDAAGSLMTMKWKTVLDWTFVKRDRKLKELPPAYQLHDSWQDIRKYFIELEGRCSRATAFRKLKEGFRIPRPEPVKKIEYAHNRRLWWYGCERETVRSYHTVEYPEDW